MQNFSDVLQLSLHSSLTSKTRTWDIVHPVSEFLEVSCIDISDLFEVCLNLTSKANNIQTQNIHRPARLKPCIAEHVRWQIELSFWRLTNWNSLKKFHFGASWTLSAYACVADPRTRPFFRIAAFNAICRGLLFLTTDPFVDLLLDCLFLCQNVKHARKSS